MAKRGRKAITSKAKKKKAVARAVIKEGRGRITINKRALETIEPNYVRTFIAEPLILAGEIAKTVDISVSVRGGGFMGQAVSARSAIAKALVRYTKDKALEKTFREYDRLLLVDDPRQKEPKKPLGRGARAKKQKSKR
ncbi:MAG: 30S ribosomal protein S9 [Candidatus Diapherotrites archaeon]|nr:30S ribosomal protein S9 [Candidatus Diapherotrites archaeon]